VILWSNKKCLVGSRMAPDVVNPRTLELEAAKEILSELCDIGSYLVDEMIRLRLVLIASASQTTWHEGVLKSKKIGV
jgi:hypothetical protein